MIRQKDAIRLLVSDTAPLYPPRWGGPKRVWNLFSRFSRELFDITYVGVDYELVSNGKKYKCEHIGDNFKEICCAFPPHYYPWYAFPPGYYLWQIMEKQLIKDSLLNIFAYFYMHTNWHFNYILNSQPADILVCSHPWSFLTMRKGKRRFIVYDAHNCEYLLTRQILQRSIFKGPVLRKVKAIEGALCKSSDLIMVCSENEKNDFVDIYQVRPEKVHVFPNGADVHPPVPEREKAAAREKLALTPAEKVIVFVGTHYKPNVDAARLIINIIAPQLKEFKFIIVGTVIKEFSTQSAPANVAFLGGVSEEKLSGILKAADIAINPMLTGSGINLKMLDYMSYGLPVVTTECGARGIEAAGKRPMIVSGVDGFADNIDRLYQDRGLYAQMSEDARDLVKERFDWRMIGKKLEQVIIENFTVHDRK